MCWALTVSFLVTLNHLNILISAAFILCTLAFSWGIVICWPSFRGITSLYAAFLLYPRLFSLAGICTSQRTHKLAFQFLHPARIVWMTSSAMSPASLEIGSVDNGFL